MNIFPFDVGSTIKDIREAITGEKIKDPVKLAEIDLKLKMLENSLVKGQIEVNKEEAKSTNWFVAGARPFILWVGGVGLAYNFIVSPLLAWGCELAGLSVTPPTTDMTMLFNLVTAILGLGGMRTYEKLKGVSNNH